MRITRSISIRLETWEEANAYARENGLTFSGLVERSLRRELGEIVLRKEDIGKSVFATGTNAPVTIVDGVSLGLHETEGIGMSRPAPKPVGKRR